MSEQQKDEYHQLFVGFEFPPQSYTLDASTVDAYLEATRETNDSIGKREGLVPPMAVTALAMAALGKRNNHASGYDSCFSGAGFPETGQSWRYYYLLFQSKPKTRPGWLASDEYRYYCGPESKSRKKYSPEKWVLFSRNPGLSSKYYHQ